MRLRNELNTGEMDLFQTEDSHFRSLMRSQLGEFDIGVFMQDIFPCIERMKRHLIRIQYAYLLFR